MEPIDAYKDTAGRAKNFLILHDGLINTRSRSIRADWKSNFCTLMRWRQNTNIDRVDSKDAIIILREDATLNSGNFSSDSLSDLLRSAITFGVSAVDRYVHERIVKNFISAYRYSDLTKNQRDFQVPATLAIEIVNKVHAAKSNGNNIRPANEIRNVVQETLHKRPFQSWREIEYGFSLIGYKDLGKAVKEFHSIDEPRLKKIRDELNSIVARRNRIVHEGDLPRHQRGGQVYAQEIRRKWVEDSLSFLDDFISKLDAI